MTSPWLDPRVALDQRRLVDAQLQQFPMPIHFHALASAIDATQCPGELLFVGAGVGHEREVLDRAGVEYRSFTGVDISVEALELAAQRYPEATWTCDTGQGYAHRHPRAADVVVDSACLMHVEDWREHLAALCAASRRWVVLHRVPLVNDESYRSKTEGYGQVFAAWTFCRDDIEHEMGTHGFVGVDSLEADGNSHTLTFAEPRHYVTYADSNYLTRLKALHVSMERHCWPFRLHVLAWDQGVADWCRGAGVDVKPIEDFLHLVEHGELAVDKLPGPRRTRVEHMLTCGPRWIADVMLQTGQPVTYVDADLYAMSSPEPFFAEAGGAPAAFVSHNFAPASRGCPGPTEESHATPFGALNVGLLHFNDVRVADAWAEMVRRWCYDRREVVGGQWQFADQKYLEQLVVDFHAVVIKNEAAMVGPWNVHARSLDVRDGVPYFGNRPIGFFHFSSYREGPHGQEQLSRPEYAINDRQAEILYTPYIRALKAAKETP